ncbi:segregation/condensation protein A [bacterium]|nr:segregation/condensation protein A [bacterium]
MAFKVNLGIYEGPLELLYHLIRNQKLLITEVSLLKITQQFLEMIELMREIDLDIAADFLRIAAILIDLKARELLPPVTREADQDEEVKNLLFQLEELQNYKNLARMLQEKEFVHSKIWYHEENVVDYEEIVEFQPTLYDLLHALKTILVKKQEARDIPKIKPDRDTVLERMNEVVQMLATRPVVQFQSLFDEDTTRFKIVLTFLALLELIRRQVVRCYQRKAFGVITIHRNFTGKAPVLTSEYAER